MRNKALWLARIWSSAPFFVCSFDCWLFFCELISACGQRLHDCSCREHVNLRVNMCSNRAL